MILDLFEYLAPEIKHCKNLEEAEKIYKAYTSNKSDYIRHVLIEESNDTVSKNKDKIT